MNCFWKKAKKFPKHQMQWKTPNNGDIKCALKPIKQ